MVPSPLSIRLKVSGTHVNDVRTHLGLFLETRQDVLLAAASETDAGDPLEGCTLDISVIITRKAAGTFYGVSVGQPTLGATFRLQAQSPWIGKTLLKTAAEGQVPGNGGSPGLAIQNALGGSSTILHKFLDQVTELRLKQLEEALRKQERDGKAREGTGPKS